MEEPVIVAEKVVGVCWESVTVVGLLSGLEGEARKVKERPEYGEKPMSSPCGPSGAGIKALPDFSCTRRPSAAWAYFSGSIDSGVKSSSWCF